MEQIDRQRDRWIDRYITVYSTDTVYMFLLANVWKNWRRRSLWATPPYYPSHTDPTDQW